MIPEAAFFPPCGSPYLQYMGVTGRIRVGRAAYRSPRSGSVFSPNSPRVWRMRCAVQGEIERFYGRAIRSG